MFIFLEISTVNLKTLIIIVGLLNPVMTQEMKSNWGQLVINLDGIFYNTKQSLFKQF